VLLVGLTGGIGSGKSTVASLLAERGATILDADVFARDAVRAGTPAFDRVVERFGADVVLPGGELDRGRLASIVFRDDAARRDLEAIVHPEVGRMIAAGIAAHEGTDDVVVLVSPLLVEMGTDAGSDVVVVVVADADVRLDRLVARGMDREDATARMDVQSPVERQAARADVVLDNDGTPEELVGQVDRLWDHLLARARAPGA
jgi:dephospho-CoA kinase